METIVRLVTILGTVGLILGLFWGLFGLINFLQSKKNGDRKGMDDGIESMIYGGVIAIVSPSMAASIVTALQSITF